MLLTDIERAKDIRRRKQKESNVIPLEGYEKTGKPLCGVFLPQADHKLQIINSSLKLSVIFCHHRPEEASKHSAGKFLRSGKRFKTPHLEIVKCDIMLGKLKKPQEVVGVGILVYPNYQDITAKQTDPVSPSGYLH